MTKPFILGLTGSIGMGKSTTAKMFADLGLQVWDADAAVHRLYAKGGAAVTPMQKLRPEAVVDGAVDRNRLKEWIASDDSALEKIERVVHPLVGEDRAAFLANAASDIVVLDIPLLFETGGDKKVDAVAVVSAPEHLQRTRVLARPGMTEEHLDSILKKQMPDSEKRACADYLVPTDTLEHARDAVKNIVEDIRAKRNA